MEKDSNAKMKTDGQQPKFEIKRFLRIGQKTKAAGPTDLPTPPASRPGSTKSGRSTPRSISSVTVPFAEDHGLEKKYGKFGKVLGIGAGGAVQVLTNADGLAVAVKRFRTRHPLEEEQSYSEKITAEYTIGSMLHHDNIIKTLDLIKERGLWYQVMEYAPYDLFESVKGGKMGIEELHCCWVQILKGANYIHRCGFAHRDLKLENVVVTESGIMKLIDFGSATVYKYSGSSEIMFASGNVGCEPYMAPEMLTVRSYDPRAVDVWSLAIIYCCMMLHRFPWKKASLSDPAFAKFTTKPPPSPTLEPIDAKLLSTQTFTYGSSMPDDPVGPWRVLRCLPMESRAVIGGMLELNPKRRLSLRQVLEDPWISSIPVCVQDSHGNVQHAASHTHTLASGAPGLPAK